MKKILMLGTGGTIASRQTKDGLAPGLTPEDILSYIPAVKNVCEVQTKQVCNLDSTNVTPEHWKMMVKAVEDNYAYYDGFVICHGTDTLAYTAAALSYMIQNSAKPIVVTDSVFLFKGQSENGCPFLFRNLRKELKELEKD